MEKMEKILSEFGKSYINNVRDNSLFVFEGILSGHMKDKESQILYEKLKELPESNIDLIKEIAYKMIDLTIHNTLFYFEQSIDDWKISNPKTETEDLASLSDGFSGELYTEDGWIKKYSKYKSSL